MSYHYHQGRVYHGRPQKTEWLLLVHFELDGIQGAEWYTAWARTLGAACMEVGRMLEFDVRMYCGHVAADMLDIRFIDAIDVEPTELRRAVEALNAGEAVPHG